MSTTVTSSTSGASQGTGTSGTSKSTLGKDDFLRLLTTQMQNQDPLNPMDNTEFVAQLAQFSSLEQLQGVGSRLDTLLTAAATQNQLSTAGLVGRSALYTTSSIALEDGKTPTVNLRLPSSTAQTSLVISDASGQVVRSIDLGARDPGAFDFTWDGLDGSGNRLPAGSYTFSVAATDADGNKVSCTARARGTITGVTFQDGVPLLLIGGNTVKMSDVSELTSSSG